MRWGWIRHFPLWSMGATILHSPTPWKNLDPLCLLLSIIIISQFNLVSLIELGQNLSVGSFGAQNYFHVIQVNEVVEKYWREFGDISHAVIGHNHYIDIAVQFMSIDVIIDVIENAIDLF